MFYLDYVILFQISANNHEHFKNSKDFNSANYIYIASGEDNDLSSYTHTQKLTFKGTTSDSKGIHRVEVLRGCTGRMFL